MPKPKKGPRIGGSPSHQRKILANLAASLIQEERITTTTARAKLLRPYVEKMVTKARRGDLHARRLVLRKIEDTDVVTKLRDRYDELWSELTDEEVLDVSERHRIDARLARLNQLGFDTAEISLEKSASSRRFSSSDRKKAKALFFPDTHT